MGFWSFVSSGFRAIGRAVSSVCHVVVKTVKVVAKAVTKLSSDFFEKTWIGRGLSSAKKWFDNTGVGKFINKLGPIV